MISKKYKTPLYGIPFTAIIYQSEEELQRRFKKMEFVPEISEFDGGVFKYNNHIYVVLRKYKKHPTPGIIAHEAKHLVNKIFIDICQDLDRYNDEAECYLLGWIVNRLHELNNNVK